MYGYRGGGGRGGREWSGGLKGRRGGDMKIDVRLIPRRMCFTPFSMILVGNGKRKGERK